MRKQAKNAKMHNHVPKRIRHAAERNHRRHVVMLDGPPHSIADASKMDKMRSTTAAEADECFHARCRRVERVSGRCLKRRATPIGIVATDTEAQSFRSTNPTHHIGGTCHRPTPDREPTSAYHGL